MHTLYGSPISQHSRRVISLLEEAALDYKFNVVDMMNGEHMSPSYLKINPNHQVPTLLSGDVKIHESNAILRYLCNKHSLNTWYPIDINQRASVDQWLDWIQTRMSPAVTGIVLNKVFMGDDADLDAIKLGKEKMVELLPLLEEALENTLFIAGDKPTIADLALLSNIFHLSLADETPTGENTLRWYESMLKMKGVKKSLPEM